jgi:opacity protein-like surface antigen
MPMNRFSNNRLLLVSGLILCLNLLPGLAVAAKTAADYKLQLTPFVGYRLGGTFTDKDTDEEYKLENNPSAGLIINFPSKGNTEWEIYYSKQATEVRASGFVAGENTLDMDVQYLMLGGTYLFDRSNQALPYFVATVGMAHMDPGGVNTQADTFFAFSAGGGWKYFPDKRIGLRLDGRFIGTFINSNSSIFCQSGQSGSACVINTSGDILYQFELQAGVVFRF